ncbi:putative ATP-grasp superfamily ATP-dependent carboligase [Homoserinimonas aerilata]|uniref:Putative ATP-grasp superfamily ATP-dependent carboligase n=1 Tax=Homoserinimonas aerilata TaxID=1162970 RepID=A0A542YJ29_9MICO|nr:PAC2 family protein [Homoserinimonas aerilata]TQL48100.1 putative ATP-grasp superfamily ATP-dependent carboligase [Homoserinimonas aerilata]
MPDGILNGRLLVVAFEGWNDAGDAASGAVVALKELLDVYPIAEIDPEVYFDYQFNRPTATLDEEGNRLLVWPGVTVFGPVADGELFLMLGTEPSRNWKSFAAEIIEIIEDRDITGVVFLGAMLADVPHTRPISVFLTSDNDEVRRELELERSQYEGPVGILSVLAEAAENIGVETVSIWASVPHYVHSVPSPKATLALIEKLEEVVGVVIPRGDLEEQASTWEASIDTLAGDDEDMASYIHQLEQARDTVDSPEASGEAIAQEFEKYLRKRDGGKADGRGGSPA